MFTPELVVVFQVAMSATLLSGLATALWLWRQTDLRPLAGFVAMMGLWCLGHLLSPYSPGLALPLLLANPFMPNTFLHFALGYLTTHPARKRRLLRLSYGTSAFIFLCSLFGGASISPWPPFSGFIHLHPLGWLNLGWTVFLGICAHGVLLKAWGEQKSTVRRSILAIFMVGGWGLLLASSFVFPSLGINYFPYAMLALPSYVLLLVFAVMRYRMLEVNQWASRILIGLGLALLVGVASVLAASLGFTRSWLVLWTYSLVILAASAVLYPVLSRWVRQLIYPGARLDEQLLARWRSRLRQASDWPTLMQDAEQLLQQDLNLAITVSQIGSDEGPHLCCYSHGQLWQVNVTGGEELLPAQRLQIEIFASLLASACDNLERTLELAEEEKRRLDQQHLVELGALSAAMAHELRNPLNIIAMACARTEDNTRSYIQEQLRRADRLIQDLLTYGGNPQIEKQAVAVEALVKSLPQSQGVELAIEAGLQLNVDPHRLSQVLVNLLENAKAFANSRILVEASGRVVRVHNDGPAIAEELTERLFRPFVTKRPGGSGLGLAIVERIMQAHGGAVRLRTDLGWPITFELEFPL
ncbi:sensor histidine kinase [Gallaecimonas mangrovi]|uniref:sensor histidine kinase n=1 Tax=Gallaecimonas mangrovi TaxID=2291597 RepID=UPI000E20C083|nr:sensor histidine kinase [Gallaecimonas mangrovi]